MTKSFTKRIKSRSEINYDYQTIRITGSRIKKGLLAIPRSYNKFLPKRNLQIQVLLNDNDKPVKKKFSSFSSSTNENRIGGLKEWYSDNGITEGDEVLLQLIDPKNLIYKLETEREFINTTNELQYSLDKSHNVKNAVKYLNNLSKLTQSKNKIVILNEYLRLSNYKQAELRKRIPVSSHSKKENVPANIRLLLENIYQGICQVCSFSFLKVNNGPYYELHHIDAGSGHHPKNILVVCANCHKQFEYALIGTKFDEKGWLIKVRFTSNEFKIHSFMHKIQNTEFIKTTHI